VPVRVIQKSNKTAQTLVPQRLQGAIVGGLSRFTSSANGWTVRTNLHDITIINSIKEPH